MPESKMLGCLINALPNDKKLDSTKFKAFADDKIYVAEVMISVSVMIENIVRKGEITGYLHFILLPFS